MYNQLFSKEDIITCYRWRDLADTIYEKATGLQNTPEDGIIWAPTNHIKDLFNLINGNGRSYILISSFCDWGVCLSQDYPPWKDLVLFAELMGRQHNKEIGYNGIQIPSRANIGKCNINHKYALKTYGFTHETFPEIPKEIKKWYLVNNQLPLDHDKRIINIPFGVQMNSEDRWVGHCDFNTKRCKRYYLNWTDWTLERVDLKQMFRNIDDSTVIEKEIPHDQFRNDLKEHKMVICPNGVGTDTFRSLESLYCGAIPIVKHSPTIEGQNLPCIFYKDLRDILNKEYIDDSRQSIREAINHEPEVLNPIKFTYWKDRIEKERIKLLSGEYNDE